MLTRRLLLRAGLAGSAALSLGLGGLDVAPLGHDRAGDAMALGADVTPSRRTGSRSAAALSPRATPFPVPLRRVSFLTATAPSPDVRAKATFFRDTFKDPPIDVDYYRITMRKALVQIPGLPAGPTWIWGYNGQYPGPAIKSRAITTPNGDRPNGRPTIVEFFNELGNDASGKPIRTTVHLHGGHQGPDDDGHPDELIMPLAPGLSAAALPPPNAKQYNYQNEPNTGQGATLWYHDHTEEVTGRGVYMGLASFYIIEDDLDAEYQQSPDPLRRILPTGDYDVPLLLQDRRFDAAGQLNYAAAFEMDGVLGDTILVNGCVQPYFQVATRKYRFRILNGSNARVYKLALSDPRLGGFLQIGSDGGLLPRAVRRDTVEIAPAERVELIVDFSAYKDKQPADVIPVILQNVQGEVAGLEGPEGANTREIMRFDVKLNAVDDVRAIPDGFTLRPDFKRLVPLPDMQRRTFSFDDSGGWTINERPFRGPCSGRERIDAVVIEGTNEIWTLVNDSGGWVHPVHIHENEWQVVSRKGRPPAPWEAGWKDTFLLREEAVQVMTFFAKERRPALPEFRGTYVFHCHNLEHEDHMMMSQFTVVEHPGDRPPPTPKENCPPSAPSNR